MQGIASISTRAKWKLHARPATPTRWTQGERASGVKKKVRSLDLAGREWLHAPDCKVELGKSACGQDQ